MDLPFGKGRHFLKNSNRFLNALVGGYQVAFVGTVVSQAFQVATGNYGATSPIELYKDKAPIHRLPVRSVSPGEYVVQRYLPPTVINAETRGVTGLPSGYTPYLAPINNTPGVTNFGNNNIVMTLANGQQVTTPFAPGPSGVRPFNAMVLQGPKNFQSDISLYKELSTEDFISASRIVSVPESVSSYHAGNSGLLPGITAGGPARGRGTGRSSRTEVRAVAKPVRPMIMAALMAVLKSLRKSADP